MRVLPSFVGVVPVDDFPSFSEGLSLRAAVVGDGVLDSAISLPFRRDFH